MLRDHEIESLACVARNLRRRSIDSFGGKCNTLFERSIVCWVHGASMMGVKYNTGIRETDKKFL